MTAAPDGRAIVNPTGGPALASGGTGDVLLGMRDRAISRRAARPSKRRRWRRSSTAPRRIGSRSARGPPGLLASDLAAELPETAQRLRAAARRGGSSEDGSCAGLPRALKRRTRPPRRLAAALDAAGLVIGLVGPLGAGKTAFVKGLAEGLGLDPAQVASPTLRDRLRVRDARAACASRTSTACASRARPSSRRPASSTCSSRVSCSPSSGATASRGRCRRIASSCASRARSDPGAATRRELNAVAFGPVSQAVLARWRDALDRDGALGQD